jgi:hypothetical protein
MRSALLLAAALALPTEAARDCEPNCDMLWAKYTSISVTAMDTGSPVSASWRVQFDHASHDIKIDADFPTSSGRSRGTMVLVGGRILLSRGLELPRGQEINALDAPILAIKLVTAVLGRAVPVAPEAIDKERAIRTREEKVGIRFATPTAAGYLVPPWNAEGKVSKAANGDIVYELHVAGSTQDPSGRKGPPIDSRFTGRFSDVPPPILDDAMPLADWTVYGTHSTEMRTIADVRGAIQQAVKPGVPDPSKNFTGMWKHDCAQDAGLQIKPYGDQGMYSVSYCSEDACWEPGTFRPNTFITGDVHYKVVSDVEIQMQEPGGFVTYQKCSSNPEPAS